MFTAKRIRRIAYLLILAVFALVEYVNSDLVRRTFVFYTFAHGKPVVEDRMLPVEKDREASIARYVAEYLLGPVSLDTAPLVSTETRLKSLLYRNDTVYADLSIEAAIAEQGSTGIFQGMLALDSGIRRNFAYVSDVKLFIEGNEVLFDKF